MRHLRFLAALTPALLFLSPPSIAQSPPATEAIAPPAGEKLALPTAKGDIGPFRNALVAISQKVDAEDENFHGRVIALDDKGARQTYALPDQDEPPTFFAINVKAVLFANVDAAAGNEIIVLYRAMKTGPQETPYSAACVYKWDGGKFVRLPAAEALLAGARDERSVRAILRKHQGK